MNNSEKSRRDRIIDASKSIFVEKGFNGTSMRDIAKASEVQTSLIYHYFENKQVLWKHVRKDFVIGSNNKIRDCFRGERSLEDFIKTFIGAHIDFFKKNKAFLRMIYWQHLEEEGEQMFGGNDKENPGVWEETVDKLKAYQASGEIKKETNILFAMPILWGFIFGPYCRTGKLHFKTKAEIVEYTDFATSTFLKSIAK